MSSFLDLVELNRKNYMDIQVSKTDAKRFFIAFNMHKYLNIKYLFKCYSNG